MAIDTLTADSPVNRAQPRNPAAAPTQWGEHEVPDTGTTEMSFWDFVDVINPLQHIPVVGSIYRELTGDQINGTARIMGGTLFGGIIGAAVSVASVVVEQASGKDPGEPLLAAMGFGGDDPGAAEAKLADASAAALAPEAETPSPPGPSPALASTLAPTPTPAAPPPPAPALPPTMAEARPAGETLLPATARNTKNYASPTRPGEAAARSFPVPPRSGGLIPRPMPVPPTSAHPELTRAASQRAAVHTARPTAAATSQTATPQASQQQADTWPPGGPAPLPPALVADAMANALNKYQQGMARKDSTAGQVKTSF
jgi:hypothetical protein